jgi:crotonobetainyl-CoA:carnitine CoA-transferase CaiB-like acyl-CoA transferase
VIASFTGYPGGPPTWSTVDVNYPDQLVSLLGAGVVCAAWWRGGGATIDVAQRETVTWTLASYIATMAATGRVPGPRGNARPGYRLHEVVACSDGGWLAASVIDDDEDRAFDLVAPGTDARADRLAVWAASRPRDAAVAALWAAGVPAAPVLDAAERRRRVHFARRRVFLDHPRRKGFPFVAEGRPLPEPASAPAVGEHNRLIAGLSATSASG